MKHNLETHFWLGFSFAAGIWLCASIGYEAASLSGIGALIVYILHSFIRGFGDVEDQAKALAREASELIGKRPELGYDPGAMFTRHLLSLMEAYSLNEDEQQAVIITVRQAFRRQHFDAEEFRSLIERLPMLPKIIADHQGVNVSLVMGRGGCSVVDLYEPLLDPWFMLMTFRGYRVVPQV